MAIDLMLARQRGATGTSFVRAGTGEGEMVHLAPAGGGGIWGESFCGRTVAHGVLDAEADRGEVCERCARSAADWSRQGAAALAPRTTRQAAGPASTPDVPSRAQASAAENPPAKDAGKEGGKDKEKGA